MSIYSERLTIFKPNRLYDSEDAPVEEQVGWYNLGQENRVGR